MERTVLAQQEAQHPVFRCLSEPSAKSQRMSQPRLRRSDQGQSHAQAANNETAAHLLHSSAVEPMQRRAEEVAMYYDI
jgi:hypothetical protein